MESVFTVIETPTFTRLWPDYWTEDERGEFVRDDIPANVLAAIRETLDAENDRNRTAKAR